MSAEEKEDRANLLMRARMANLSTLKLNYHLADYAAGKPVSAAGLQSLALAIIADLADIAGELK